MNVQNLSTAPYLTCGRKPCPVGSGAKHAMSADAHSSEQDTYISGNTDAMSKDIVLEVLNAGAMICEEARRRIFSTHQRAIYVPIALF